MASALEAGHTTNREALLTAARRVAADQGANGAWEIDTQSVAGSPATYGSVLATYTALNVLQRAGTEQTAAEKAERWLATVKPANLLETATILRARDHSSTQAAAVHVRSLQRAQTSDGGWGPFPDSPPEVFDTAIVLLALTGFRDKEGVAQTIERGRAFLAGSQNDDGSWPATTRPRGGESYAQQMSTTAWATLALLHTR